MLIQISQLTWTDLEPVKFDVPALGCVGTQDESQRVRAALRDTRGVNIPKYFWF